MEPVESTPIETTAESSTSAPRAAAPATTTESTVAHRNISEWQGRDLVDRDGDRIGRLEDVYYDVETEEPQFGTVKEGLINRHLTFVPLAWGTIGPDNLQVTVTKAQVKKAPSIGLHDFSPIDEPTLYHLLLPAQLHAARHGEWPSACATMTDCCAPFVLAADDRRRG